MKLSKGASSDTHKYMVDGIRYVCENFKKRSPGSHSERKAQKYLKTECEKFADKVEIEDFDLHPLSFMGWIPIAGVMTIITIAFYWLTYTGVVKNSALAIVSLIINAISVACFILEFLMYREFIDFIFPKKTSKNVMARRAPKGEVKRRIIFGGHTDAAYEWTYSIHGGLKSLATVIGGSIGGLFVVTFFDIAWLIYSFVNGSYDGKFWLVAGIIQLCLVPFLIAICFFINWKIIVEGANDNLSAVYIAMGVLKEMADNDLRFENTEVCALLSGSEEAGLRGAVAYAKAHKEELQEVESVYIAMDTMREIEQLQIYTQGCTGTQKNSNAVAEIIYEAGVNCGIEMKETDIYPGAIDSEGFSRHGLNASGFCGVNHDPRTYYHTRLDTPDNISEECINLSLDICLEAAKLYDEKGGLDAFREDGKKRFKKGHNN